MQAFYPKYVTVGLLGLFAACCATASMAGESLQVEVLAGRQMRRNTPVAFKLPGPFRKAQAFSLTRLDADRPVDVQLEEGDVPRLVWLIRDPIEAGQTRRYRVDVLDTPVATEADAVCEDDGRHLTLRVDGRPVLRYNHAVIPSPVPEEPYWARSGHIHPVFSPSGKEVTGDFPEDHMHQHGLFFAWVKTTFEGREIDFWNQAKQQGTVEHVRIESTVDGPVFAEFTARLRHIDQSAPDGPKPVLEETWTVRAYDVNDCFLFDIKSLQTCSGNSPLTVEEYHYGGMAIRGNYAWLDPTQGDFLTDQGKTRADGNHSRPRWVDMFGLLDGQTCGVTVMDHPTNFQSPQSVRLNPKKPYFCFAPMVLGAFEIKPGKPYASAYRYMVHDGPVDPKQADRFWNDYARPPKVRVVKQ